MPYENPVTVHCSNCGGENVKRDAHAEWNPELQTWELCSTYDDFYCEDCGHDVSTYERAVSVMQTVYISNVFPAQGLAMVEGVRRAQIVAKLMGERFPGHTFGYGKAPMLTDPNMHHHLQIGVKTVEVQRLTETELKDEADDNPKGLEKWLAFVFDNGQGPEGGPQISAYLEHDRDVVKRCKADPTLAEVIPIYSKQPSIDELASKLDAWVEARA